jgi:hypothetical protein
VQHHRDWAGFLDQYNCCVSQKSVANHVGSHFICLQLPSIQKLRGVPCMTRVLHHGLPLRRSYHHHQRSLRKSEASKQPQYACRRTLRGYVKCPRMLITNNNRTGHKKQVYQIVTEKPNNMNSAADPALHMVLKKKKMQRNRKESLKSWQVPWYCTRLVIG